MHIAMANFYLLSVTGPKMPADLKEDMEKKVTIEGGRDQLAQALAGCRQTRRILLRLRKHLARKVRIEGRHATVDGMYLRIIVHANEHMGQLVAYARMTGVVPPWSEK